MFKVWCVAGRPSGFTRVSSYLRWIKRQSNGAVAVDDIPLAQAQPSDRFGRDLPVWQGCHFVAKTELFLLNPSHPDSLDGRYFGALPADAVIGRAVPILTDEDGDGHYVWRADHDADALENSSDRK